MNQFNDDPRPADENKVRPESENHSSEVTQKTAGMPAEEPLLSYTPTDLVGASPYPPGRTYPEDLQISWSWVHFLIFSLFVISLMLGLQLALLAKYGPHGPMTQGQVEKFEEFLLSRPELSIGGTVLTFALVLFFLYVSLALLPGKPFWKTLGWRKIGPIAAGISVHPIVYVFAGGGLSLFILVVINLLVKRPENLPIDEVFKHRQTALLFVAMAILIAPLVEETVFRGYLYPLFARWVGVGPSVVLTGTLFGLMHGPQLGSAKSLIAVMSCVGIVFTLVRARTGSVFASYLMHLGYNSFIGAGLFLGTHGFTQMPPGQ